MALLYQQIRRLYRRQHFVEMVECIAHANRGEVASPRAVASRWSMQLGTRRTTVIVAARFGD